MTSILKVDTIQTSSGTGGLTVPTTSGTVSTVSGITMADMWRQTSDVTGDLDPIRGNFSQASGDGFANIGSDMSVTSGGIWTFPETGVYHIAANARFQHQGSDYSSIQIKTTTDNSTYATAGRADSGTTSGIAFTHSRIDFFFNVTDTTTHKVKFSYIAASQSNVLKGSSAQNETYFMFIRLGDAQ